MSSTSNKILLRLIVEQFNEEKRYHFLALGNSKHYSQEQKRYAFELIDEYGIRSTARILKIPRRTLQRWCRTNFIYVKRCPDWVYGWAQRRRKRREFWQRRGYY